jgi:hypothetical protein
MRTWIIVSINVIALLGSCCSIQAITWCHDYTMYRLSESKVDYNRISVSELRQYLIDHQYKKFPYTNAAENPKAQDHLKPGDVIIIGDAHSGFVNEEKLIDHFIQMEGASGAAYKPEEIPMHMNQADINYKKGGFFMGDTLIQMRSRMFTKNPLIIEVWRKNQ